MLRARPRVAAVPVEAPAEREALGTYAILRSGTRQFAVELEALVSVNAVGKRLTQPREGITLSGAFPRVVALPGASAEAGLVAEVRSANHQLALRFDALDEIRELYADEVDSRFPDAEASTLPGTGEARRIFVLDERSIVSQMLPSASPAHRAVHGSS